MECSPKQEDAYQRLLIFGEEGLGLLVGDAGVDNDIVALVPVDRGGDLVLVTELEGIDHSDDFVERTTSLRRVGDGEADNFLGVNHEDSSKRGYKIQVECAIKISLTGR